MTVSNTPTCPPTLLKLSEHFGSVLVGRSPASELRTRILEVANIEDVVVDFDGVQSMSPSFADELFAKIPSELLDSGRVAFVNVPAQLESLMRFVVAGRSFNGAADTLAD